MAEIIPAIMPQSVEDLRERVALVADAVETVQLDIMDGLFVPERTWPYTRSGREDFDVFAREAEGLPLWEKINYEVDLMVKDQEKALTEWVSVGAARAILHAEAAEDLAGIINRFRERFPKNGDRPHEFVELGVAINIDTGNEVLEELIPRLDFVQFMGIAKIGYQGQPFDPRVLPKIAAWKVVHPEATISVDGGVTDESARSLVAAGCNRLVSGSFIFESGNIEDAIEELKSIS
jgi:ribulose-phosphate 3-epimerase